MNLGAFAIVIAVARRTRSGEISSFAGLFATSPVLAVTMTLFLASLAGVPPLAGLVRQVRDVPGHHRGRHGLGRLARRDRRRQLGDRVLLLLRRRPQDVVRRAGRRRSHAHPCAARARRRDRADGCGRRRDRRVPAAVRGSGSGRSNRTGRRRGRASSGAKVRSRSIASWKSRCTNRAPDSSRPATAPDAPGATSSRVPKWVRCSARASPARSIGAGASSRSRIRSWSSRPAPATGGSRVTSPDRDRNAQRVALRARRAVGRVARGAARAAPARARRRGARAVHPVIARRLAHERCRQRPGVRRARRAPRVGGHGSRVRQRAPRQPALRHRRVGHRRLVGGADRTRRGRRPRRGARSRRVG